MHTTRGQLIGVGSLGVALGVALCAPFHLKGIRAQFYRYALGYNPGQLLGVLGAQVGAKRCARLPEPDIGEGDHDGDSDDSNEDNEDNEDRGLACDELGALGSGDGAPLTCVVRRVSSSLGPSLPLARCVDRRSLARLPAHRSLVVHLSSVGCGSPAASFISLL